MEHNNSELNRAQFWSSADPNYVGRLGELQRCLVIIPHPDDESLACAGLIAILTERGVNVQAILITDGSMSHPNSKNYPSERLFETRKEELEEALNLMGVASKAIKYYKVQDGSMPTIGDPSFNDLVYRLKDDLEVIQPNLILVPYELDSHPDHKATHQLLSSSITQLKFPRPKIWEYPIWLYERASKSEVPNLKNGELIGVDISSYLPLKEKCIYAHRSQTTQMINDDPEGFILDKEMIENFIHGKEYFMEREKLNPRTTLTKMYFDDVYAHSQDPWSFETSDYEREKYRATLNAIPEGTYPKAFEIGCSIGVLTEMLMAKCGHLLAMDINEIAINRASDRLARFSTKVEFLLGAIPEAFPPKNFDLIVMSEVGYYFAINDLIKVRKQIWSALNNNGILVLVHWVHFVHDYPMTGDEVHDCFNELKMSHLVEIRNADYRLDVYQKLH